LADEDSLPAICARLYQFHSSLRDSARSISPVQYGATAARATSKILSLSR